MQNFDIVRKSDIEETFRVRRIMDDFDVKLEHSNEHFTGEINYPEEWQIGIIVGNSGTGKTTIANELFKNDIIKGFKYVAKSVIDDMPKDASLNDIEKMFYSVGFGSVPSWLKPYTVLSNGEKMRVDLARAMLEKDFIVFDEFTSVVDRNVAKISSLAIAKAIRQHKEKKFIAVTCHEDIIEWLNPDWILNTNTMQCFFTQAHVLAKDLLSENVSVQNGKSLGNITI